MLFANDLVLCDSNLNTSEERLEIWRRCLEVGGLKLSRRRIEHLVPASNTAKLKISKYDIEEYAELLQTKSPFILKLGSTNMENAKQRWRKE